MTAETALTRKIRGTVNEIIKDSGTIKHIETCGSPGDGGFTFSVVFSTELAALRAFHAYSGKLSTRPGSVRFGRSRNMAGWFLSVG